MVYNSFRSRNEIATEKIIICYYLTIVKSNIIILSITDTKT